MRFVLLLWILCQPIPAESQQPKGPEPRVQQSTGGQQHQQPDIRGTPKAPLVVQLLDSVEAEQNRAEAAKDHEEKASTDRQIVGLTFGLLVVAFFQLLLFGRQLRIMDTSLKDTKSAAESAERAAKATEDSVTLARETAQQQLRAFEFVERAAILHTGLNERPGVKLKIKNFGQTPAYNYSASLLGYQFVNASEAPAVQLAIDEHKQQPVRGAVPPGGTFDVGDTLQRAFTPAEREALDKGTRLLYISGEVRYTDAFGEGRCTKYRFVYGGDYGHGTGDLALAEYGNEAD